MGQRLNIEIKKDSKVLANAYYHWSAYTSSALQMLGDILSGIDEVEASSDIEQAVRLLELTGAGVTGRERDLIQKSSLNNVINFAIQPAVDRNEGLLAVTEEGIQETREWEEGRVTVDIGTRTFSFNVLWEEDEETFRADYRMRNMKSLIGWNQAWIFMMFRLSGMTNSRSLSIRTRGALFSLMAVCFFGSNDDDATPLWCMPEEGFVYIGGIHIS